MQPTAIKAQLAFKVIDAREFDIRRGSLIVIAVLVEPWNRYGHGPPLDGS